MFLKRIFAIVLLSLFFNQISYLNLLADPCINFKEAVNAKTVNPIPFEKKNGFGIFFGYTWNKLGKKIILRDNKQYPVVSLSLSSKLTEGTVIKSINGTDLSKLGDDAIDTYLETTSSPTVVEYFDNITKKIYKTQIFKKDFNLINFYFSKFFINTIGGIEAKEGFFNLDYSYEIYYDRTDLKEEGKFLQDEKCSFPKTELKKLYFPDENVYLKQFDKDKDKVFQKISFSFNKEDDVTFAIQENSGISKIRQKFDFSDFPRDKQTLMIPIESILTNDIERKIPRIFRIVPSENLFQQMNEFKKINFLQEWRVLNVNVFNSWNKGDNTILQIDIKRYATSYFYKIILPILLIFAVAWSVLWIPPKEQWVESRLTTSIVALLSLIAYNFVFQDDIPKIDILTRLDKFILWSYFFCSIPIFTTIFLSRIADKSQQRAIQRNRLVRYVGGVLYASGTLYFLQTI